MFNEHGVANKLSLMENSRLLIIGLVLATTPLAWSDVAVASYQKISDVEGNFSGSLDNSDHFGRSVAAIGDLDGDGNGDLAIGAYEDDDGGTDRGAVWILFLNNNGTVKSSQKISNTAGGFGGTLDNTDYFGVSVVAVGDLDSDGVIDLAVGQIKMMMVVLTVELYGYCFSRTMEP